MNRLQTGYCVLDAMTTKPVVVTPHTSLQDAARKMRDADVGSLLVKEGEELLGIVTEWDFVHRAVVEGLDVTTTPIALLMVKDLLTISPSMDIFDALQLMRDADIRHLPVLDGTKMVGFITAKDILKIQPQLFELIVEKYELRTKSEEEEF